MYITTRKVKQILGSIFFGGLIGAGLMSIGMARSNADPMPYIVSQFLADGGSDLVCQTFGKYGITPDTIGKIGVAMMNTYHMTAREAAIAEEDSVLLTCPEMYSTLTSVAINSPTMKGSVV